MTKKKQQKTSFLSQRLQETLGLLLLATAGYLLLSLITHSAADPSFSVSAPSAHVANLGGKIGAYFSGFMLEVLGLSCFTIPAIFALHAVQMMMHKDTNDTFVRIISLPVVLIALSVILQMWNPIPFWPNEDGIGNGGLLGKLTLTLISPMIGLYGTCALAVLTIFLGTLWWSGLHLEDIYGYTRCTQTMVRHWVMCAFRAVKRFKFRQSLQIDLPLPNPPMKKVKPKVERVIEQPQPKKTSREESERQGALPLNLNDEFNLPPLHLLDENNAKFEGASEQALQQNARQIETQLANFGITGSVTKICPGPVITIYELEPAAGVKTSQVVNLANDLARAMSATSIRIAPIPGRSVIGIEMPNHKRRTVMLKELLETESFETNAGKLAVALGVDTSGTPIYADISKMPHALIAGTTGSGKSVAMNAFILSLVYRMSPDQLRFLMIDPKMLELSIYNDIPHLLSPVIIDPHKASSSLKWVVKEMEHRYKLMSELHVKNIQSFNAKFEELQAKGEVPTRMVQTGFDPATGQPKLEEQKLCDRPFPYIVVVIDELADLMMVAGKDVEISIARLAQMARASGIHLLIATQRPSVDVITGLIKANIPTRMSFNVTSKIDSRTVLDQMGAEQLLGKGDMLYMGNGSNTLDRLHGAFVSEDECNKVAAYLKEQAKPVYVDNITKPGSAGEGDAGGSTDNSGIDDNDPMYQQAIELVAKEQKASTSFIQRHLQIGYNRAARLVEKMEADGMIGPANHVGKREIIVRKPPEEGY